MKSWKIDFKNCTSYYFDDIINIANIDLDSILLDERTYGYILIYDVAYKTPYSANLYVLFSIKQMDIVKNIIELNIQHA